MFEMTASFTLTPDRPGIPHFDLPHKLQEQHRAFFPEGQHISEDSGRLLAEWARGGSVPPTQPDMATDTPPLIVEGNMAAERGREAFAAFWNRLTKGQRQAVGGVSQRDRWLAQATEADAVDTEQVEDRVLSAP